MGFSIALERSLVAEINRYAEAEGRNRNQQIRWMLLESLGERAKERAITHATMGNVPKTDSKPPIRLKVSPDAQKPRKNDSGQACA